MTAYESKIGSFNGTYMVYLITENDNDLLI